MTATGGRLPAASCPRSASRPRLRAVSLPIMRPHIDFLRTRSGRRAALPRSLLAALLLGLSSTAPAVARQGGRAPTFDVVEATIRELQDALTAGRVTSLQLVDAYLARVDAYDQRGPALNAMIRLNPNARSEAAALDEERAARGARGPLHGIPIILKDNYDTADMPTTAGSIALAGLVPPDDAFQVKQLREAGAIILGKSNLHELAMGITTISSLGGQTKNPMTWFGIREARAVERGRPSPRALRPLGGAATPAVPFGFRPPKTT